MAPRASQNDAVAGVLIDTPLLHLDRIFDYRIPEKLADQVAVGSAVRVRFARRLVSGWVVEVRPSSSHPGPLAPVERVLGEPVLTQATISACRAVADRWVGTFADVVRTAVPPRVAAIDLEEPADTSPGAVPADADAHAPAADAVHGLSVDDRAALAVELEAYPGLSEGLRASDPLRAALVALPGRDPMRLLAAVVASRAAVGGVLVVLPDAADVHRLSAIVARTCPVPHATLTAQMGRNARWRAFRDVRSGRSRVVIGTRGAAFAPVAQAATFIIWDDGATTHTEPHAPYWHVREVLALRAQHEGAAFICAGTAMTAEAAALIQRRWLTLISGTPATVRECAPRVQAVAASGDGPDRLAGATGTPHAVFTALRSGLNQGPVLVLAPRRGYIPVVSCAGCRKPRRCAACGAGVNLTAEGLRCDGCSAVVPAACPDCGSRSWRAVSIGQDRLLEQFGKAFPGVRLISSNADRRVARVHNAPAIVIATPGCEPIADSGYAAVVALDVATWLALPDLRAEQFAFTRLAQALSMARAGAAAVIVADPGTAVAQALIRWDPVGFAERQLTERAGAHLAPAARVVLLRGAARDLLAVLDAVDVPTPSSIIGPEPQPDGSATAIVSIPWRYGPQFSERLRAVLAERQAARRGDPVAVVVDPGNPV